MSRCDRCGGEIQTMFINSERPYNGGTLIVTDVPVEKCGCDDGDQILVGDGALMAGYARHLAHLSIVGTVQVSLNDLKRKFTLQDFVSKRISPA